MSKPGVCIIGGGMITQVQILPAFYQLQRLGLVGEIRICPGQRSVAGPGRRSRPAKGVSGAVVPGPSVVGNRPGREAARVVSGRDPRMGRGNIVVVAMPDHLHYLVIQEAIRHDQHICCVKPLVLCYEQALEIERQACEKGLVVGIEYHKRLDDRAAGGPPPVSRGPFRRVQAWAGRVERTLLLSPLELHELVHLREFRYVLLCRLPLCRPGALYYGAPAVLVVGLRHRRLLPQRQSGLPLDQRPGDLAEPRAA